MKTNRERLVKSPITAGVNITWDPFKYDAAPDQSFAGSHTFTTQFHAKTDCS